MADEVPMFTSCPLCLSPDEVQSMVTVEIDRRIAGGRTSIMICRSCAGAVIRAVEELDPPLVDPKVFQLIARAEAPAGEITLETRKLAQEYLEGVGEQAESAKLHEGEEPDDGTSTD